MFSAPTTHSPALRRIAALTALACSALALNGCGGGSRAAPYKPSRMVSFGDENSAIETFTASNLFETDGTTPGTMKGLLYTVNTVVGVTNGYICPETGVATRYTACTSDIGNVTSPWATNNVSQWFVETELANVLTNVQHDTTNNTRIDVDYAWSCSSSVLWTQYIAHAYGLGYGGATGQCPSDNYTNAVTYAAYGARTADVVNQINSHLGELGKGTLVTVMAGQWDILDAYTAYKASPNDDTLNSLKSQMVSKADALIAGIQAIVQTGAKVVVVAPIDMGETPLAYADNVAGHDRSASNSNCQGKALYTLSCSYTSRLYQLGNDRVIASSGRVVAFVNPESFTDPRNTNYVLGNNVICPAVDSNDTANNGDSTTKLRDPVGNKVTTALTGDAAYSLVKYCNTATSTLTSTNGTYMWADQIHFSPLGHSLIGALGYSRSSNQF